MRILIFGLNYAPELTGIGKYTGEMAAWLSAQGHAVHVVTAPPYYPAWRVHEDYRGKGYVREGGGPAGDGVGVPLVIRCPLYVPAVPTGMKRMLHLLSFALSGVPALLREVFAKPDIIFTVEPAFFCAPFAVACGALADAPVWLHVQDFEIDAAFDLGLLPKHPLLRTPVLALEGAITRAFDVVSSISMRMVERLLVKKVPADRTLLFPNWVNVDAVRPAAVGAANSFREMLGLQGKIVLLYSGNMGGKQGLEMLGPLAVALMDDPRVHFMFCGDGAFRPQLEAMVAGMTNVSLLHLQPMESLSELLNAADIHLLPQREDAADLVMPSKLTGMLSSGRPTIVTAHAGTEVAGVVGGSVVGSGGTHEACGLVVPPGDVSAVVAAVRVLVDDAAMRLRMGASARRYAEQNLGTEQVLKQFEGELQRAVNEYRGVARVAATVA